MFFQRYNKLFFLCFSCFFSVFINGCGLLGWGSVTQDNPLQTIQKDAEASSSSIKASPIPYLLTITVNGVKRNIITAEDATTLQTDFEKISQLEALHNTPPDSRVALERRIVDDITLAEKFLQSRGYYRGQVRYNIDWKTQPVQINIILVPRKRFLVTSSVLHYIIPQKNTLDARATKIINNIPRSLEDFGLEKNAPVETETITAAVDAVPIWLQQHGFPFAEIKKTRYLLYPSRNTLEPEITVDTGSFFYFGALQIEGAESVERAYLEHLTPWTEGHVWRADRLDVYIEELQRTNLFNEIIVEAGNPEDARDNRLPVQVRLRERPARRVSGGLQYSSNEGFGIHAAWKHFNFLGAGEQFTVSAPITREQQGLRLDFKKPSFIQKNQNLVAGTELMRYSTESYELEAFGAELGLERQFSRRWWASIHAAGQVGRLNENNAGWQDVYLLGFPTSVRYDGSNDLLNPTAGARVQLTVTPWFGSYQANVFSVLKGLFSISGYHAFSSLATKETPDKVVFAARARLGSIFGTPDNNLQRLPGSLRFYTGGGGSVRGYDYQTIGARNSVGDPEGGLSLLDLGAELRLKLFESFGIVPFLDGGMVYDTLWPKLNQEIRWGAGLGFRYYSPIGPVSVDFAMPLNPRDNKHNIHLYINIGQTF